MYKISGLRVFSYIVDYNNVNNMHIHVDNKCVYNMVKVYMQIKNMEIFISPEIDSRKPTTSCTSMLTLA